MLYYTVGLVAVEIAEKTALAVSSIGTSGFASSGIFEAENSG